MLLPAEESGGVKVLLPPAQTALEGEAQLATLLARGLPWPTCVPNATSGLDLSVGSAASPRWPSASGSP